MSVNVAKSERLQNFNAKCSKIEETNKKLK